MSDFDALVRRFERPLLRYAARIIGDEERSRDVVQDVFVQLQIRLKEQHSEVSAKWLFTVCRNRALNLCRKDRRLAFIRDDDSIFAVEKDEQTPVEQLEREEANDFLMRIVATLPPRQQEVLQLRFQNDLSYREIGEIIGLTATHVGVLIHNALHLLRRQYQRSASEFISVGLPQSDKL